MELTPGTAGAVQEQSRSSPVDGGWCCVQLTGETGMMSPCSLGGLVSECEDSFCGGASLT